MKINMQVVLESEEIKEAVRQFVYDKVSAAADSPLIVEFPGLDDIDLNATVTIDDGMSVEEKQSNEENKPKRTRRTKAQIEADEAAYKAKLETASPPEHPAPTYETEKEMSTGSALPWSDPVTSFDDSLSSDEVITFNPNGTTSVVQIFPNQDSSAPMITNSKAPPAEPSPAAKSLFANLN